MRVIIIALICAVSVTTHAAPVLDESQATIEKYENSIDEKGNYKFSFKTSNGISKSEDGTIKNEGQPDEHIEVFGEYSYIDAEGKEVVVRYYADDTGFHIIPIVESVPFGGPSPAVLASLLG